MSIVSQARTVLTRSDVTYTYVGVSGVMLSRGHESMIGGIGQPRLLKFIEASTYLYTSFRGQNIAFMANLRLYLCPGNL